ncbi:MULTISPECIES: carbohydrate ABC transporter permease [unclassified Devosia]|jgi:multiple sugar transport system permease protein|uniref:carbohydrate ABC transporter permease n=1 Tax=unclassified Devosia TaxID=196773 RepID=UPI00086C7393|nr:MULTISPECIES: carbohydrate ABC transporter permease [unclassified Devosia]MBN9360048.1 carbohydrate ABC transporter permease [Devosia sp.]ODS86898.1 MAG: ABC transporter permease [Devosia sp. SCN 66-27]OJX22108.1 MAG: ABC transporter permease [Devosia sp. 66-14]
MRLSFPQLLARIGFSALAAIIGILFALPLIWFIFAPFNARAELGIAIPDPWTLQNFVTVFGNGFAMRGLLNSLIQSVGGVILVAAAATLAAYALSRSSIPGKGMITYVLLLFSSVVSGTAAMVPIFLIVSSVGLMDTHIAVILVFAGGLLPTAMFILRDFIDGIPKTYEESAMVAGASPVQAFFDVALPVIRPGIVVVVVWAFVNIWGSFLIPFILLRSDDLMPSSVAIYSFYSEAGTPIVTLLAAYSLIYSLPVVALYLFVSWKFGFRFFGGIKA